VVLAARSCCGRPGWVRFWAPACGPDVGGVDHRPRPVQLVLRPQLVQQQLVKLVPHAGLVPGRQAAPAGHARNRSPAPGAGTPTGCRCAGRTGCRIGPAGRALEAVPPPASAAARAATARSATTVRPTRSTAATDASPCHINERSSRQSHDHTTFVRASYELRHDLVLRAACGDRLFAVWSFGPEAGSQTPFSSGTSVASLISKDSACRAIPEAVGDQPALECG
jgi:hypothetical protein